MDSNSSQGSQETNSTTSLEITELRNEAQVNYQIPMNMCAYNYNMLLEQQQRENVFVNNINNRYYQTYPVEVHNQVRIMSVCNNFKEFMLNLRHVDVYAHEYCSKTLAWQKIVETVKKYGLDETNMEIGVHVCVEKIFSNNMSTLERIQYIFFQLDAFVQKEYHVYVEVKDKDKIDEANISKMMEERDLQESSARYYELLSRKYASEMNDLKSKLLLYEQSIEEMIEDKNGAMGQVVENTSIENGTCEDSCSIPEDSSNSSPCASSAMSTEVVEESIDVEYEEINEANENAVMKLNLIEAKCAQGQNELDEILMQIDYERTQALELKESLQSNHEKSVAEYTEALKLCEEQMILRKKQDAIYIDEMKVCMQKTVQSNDDIIQKSKDSMHKQLSLAKSGIAAAGKERDKKFIEDLKAEKNIKILELEKVICAKKKEIKDMRKSNDELCSKIEEYMQNTTYMSNFKEKTNHQIESYKSQIVSCEKRCNDMEKAHFSINEERIKMMDQIHLDNVTMVKALERLKIINKKQEGDIRNYAAKHFSAQKENDAQKKCLNETKKHALCIFHLSENILKKNKADAFADDQAGSKEKDEEKSTPKIDKDKSFERLLGTLDNEISVCMSSKKKQEASQKVFQDIPALSTQNNLCLLKDKIILTCQDEEEVKGVSAVFDELQNIQQAKSDVAGEVHVEALVEQEVHVSNNSFLKCELNEEEVLGLETKMEHLMNSMDVDQKASFKQMTQTKSSKIDFKHVTMQGEFIPKNGLVLTTISIRQYDTKMIQGKYVRIAPYYSLSDFIQHNRALRAIKVAPSDEGLVLAMSLTKKIFPLRKQFLVILKNFEESNKYALYILMRQMLPAVLNSNEVQILQQQYHVNYTTETLIKVKEELVVALEQTEDRNCKSMICNTIYKAIPADIQHIVVQLHANRSSLLRVLKDGPRQDGQLNQKDNLDQILNKILPYGNEEISSWEKTRLSPNKLLATQLYCAGETMLEICRSDSDVPTRAIYDIIFNVRKFCVNFVQIFPVTKEHFDLVAEGFMSEYACDFVQSLVMWIIQPLQDKAQECHRACCKKKAKFVCPGCHSKQYCNAECCNLDTTHHMSECIAHKVRLLIRMAMPHISIQESFAAMFRNKCRKLHNSTDQKCICFSCIVDKEDMRICTELKNIIK